MMRGRGRGVVCVFAEVVYTREQGCCSLYLLTLLTVCLLRCCSVTRSTIAERAGRPLAFVFRGLAVVIIDFVRARDFNG